METLKKLYRLKDDKYSELDCYWEGNIGKVIIGPRKYFAMECK